jgi:hypothetical protein
MIDVIDAILEKSIKTIYRGESKKQDKFRRRLEDLRLERKGGLVIGVEGGPQLVITVAGTQD